MAQKEYPNSKNGHLVWQSDVRGKIVSHENKVQRIHKILKFIESATNSEGIYFKMDTIKGTSDIFQFTIYLFYPLYQNY